MLLLWPLIIYTVAVAGRQYFHITTAMASHPIAVAGRQYFHITTTIASHPIAVAGRQYFHIATTAMASHPIYCSSSWEAVLRYRLALCDEICCIISLYFTKFYVT